MFRTCQTIINNKSDVLDLCDSVFTVILMFLAVNFFGHFINCIPSWKTLYIDHVDTYCFIQFWKKKSRSIHVSDAFLIFIWHVHCPERNCGRWQIDSSKYMVAYL